MIELFSADTPNGKKVSIMLEEIEFKYEVTKINIYKNEIEISARFWPIFDFGLNEKRSQAKPSRAENPSARLGLITALLDTKG